MSSQTGVSKTSEALKSARQPQKHLKVLLGGVDKPALRRSQQFVSEGGRSYVSSLAVRRTKL